MRARSRSLLLVLLVIVGSVLDASANTYRFLPHYDWTFEAGSRKFGLEGYTPVTGLGGNAPSVFNTTTVIHYGFGASSVERPVIVVAAVFVTLPLLVCAGYLLRAAASPLTFGKKMKIASITTLLLTIFSLAFVWWAWSNSYDAGKRIFDAHAAANMEGIRWGLKDLYIWQGLIGTGLLISIPLSLSSLVLTLMTLRKTEQGTSPNRA